MNRLLLVVGFALFAQLTDISAQLVLVAPTLNNLQPGALVDIPVRVNGFTKIIGLQFPVKWDPAVLKYQGVNSFTVLSPGINLNDFGLIDTSSGIVRFSWYNVPSGGKTVADNTAIFKIKVKVVGPVNSSTAITFPVNVPDFPIEFVQYVTDTTSKELFVTSVPGVAAVGFTVSLENGLSANHPSAFDVFPNPFGSKINIRPKYGFGPQNCRISVRDVSGCPVFEETKNLLPSAGMEIDMDGVQNGIYFLIIKSEHETFSRKLVKAE